MTSIVYLFYDVIITYFDLYITNVKEKFCQLINLSRLSDDFIFALELNLFSFIVIIVGQNVFITY